MCLELMRTREGKYEIIFSSDQNKLLNFTVYNRYSDK